MTFTLKLTEFEEAKLLTQAQAEGTTPEQLMCRAIQPLLNAGSKERGVPCKPKNSSRGALAHLGPAPSAEDIDNVRKEMFTSLALDDF